MFPRKRAVPKRLAFTIEEKNLLAEFAFAAVGSLTVLYVLGYGVLNRGSES
jgi:hypothetical protein